MLNGLGKWLEEVFDWKPVNEGNILARSRQMDTISCAVCVLNTIAHNIFGDQLWEQSNASGHRVSWLPTFDKHMRLCAPGEAVSLPNFGSAMADALTQALRRRTSYSPTMMENTEPKGQTMAEQQMGVRTHQRATSMTPRHLPYRLRFPLTMTMTSNRFTANASATRRLTCRTRGTLIASSLGPTLPPQAPTPKLTRTRRPT